MDIDDYLESLMKTEKPSKFPLSMYCSEGKKYLRLFQYEKALKFLNEAIEHDSINVKSLLQRSKCYICIKEYRKAIDDADKVLQICPNNVHAIDLKGEAQYLMGDFEGGYLTYLEGRKISPSNHILRLGTQLCQDALNNSLHPRLGMKYKKSDVTNILTAGKDEEKFHKLLKCRKSARQYFVKDAKFMEDLIADKNLKSVHGTCKEAIDYIRHRERWWSMETPFRSKKKRDETKIQKTKKFQEFETNIRLCNAAKRRAQYFLQKGKVDECISDAINLLNLAETLRKESESEKMTFKCDAYHLLSLSYKQIKNFSRAFQYLLEELKIAIKYNFTLQETKAYHQLGIIYHITGDTKGTLHCLKKVVDAMAPEKIDKLLPKSIPAEEIRQIEEADDWVNEVISEIEKSQKFENIRLCNAAKQRAVLALQNGKADDCISEATNLLSLSESLLKEHESKKMKFKCDAFHLLGLAYKQEKNFPRAIQFFMKEQEIATEYNFTLQETKAYHQLGAIYHLNNDKKGTLHCLNKVLNTMPPGRIDELLPENASVEEIKEVQKIEEWVKCMISEIEGIRHEPVIAPTYDNLRQYFEKIEAESTKIDKPVISKAEVEKKDSQKFLTDIDGTRDAKESTKPIKIKDTERLTRSTKDKDEKKSDDSFSVSLEEDTTLSELREDQLNEIESLKDLENKIIIGETVNELIESTAIQDCTQTFKEESKTEDFIRKEISDSKLMSGRLREVEKSYESSKEGISKSSYSYDKSDIKGILKTIAIEQSAGKKEEYLDDKFDTEDIIKKISTENLTQLIPFVIDKIEEPFTTSDLRRKYEDDKLSEMREIRKPSSKRESKGTEGESFSEKVSKQTVSSDDKSILEDIMKELTESIALEDTDKLIQSISEKEKTKYFIPTAITQTRDELDKTKEIKETFKFLEQLPEKSNDEQIVKSILKGLTDSVATEDTIQLVSPVKVKSKSLTIEDSYPMAQPIKKRDKTDQVTTINDSSKLKKIEEVCKMSMEKLSKFSDDESIIEEILEEIIENSDDESIVKDILKDLTDNIATDVSIHQGSPVEEKSKNNKSIQSAIVDRKDMSNRFEDIKETHEFNKKRDSQDSDDEFIIEDLSEELPENSDDGSILKNILKDLTDSIITEDTMQVDPPVKIRSKIKELIQSAIADAKDVPNKLKDIKEIDESITERDSEDSDNEMIIEEILDELKENSDDESAVKSILKGLTDSIETEDTMQTDPPVKIRSKIKELIQSPIVDAKDVPNKLKDIKEIDESITERDSEDEMVIEEILDELTENSDDEPVVKSILKGLTDSIETEDTIQLDPLVKKRSKVKESIQSNIVDIKDVPNKFKDIKAMHESNTESDSQDSDDESIIEEILEELSESVATRNVEQRISSRLEKEMESNIISLEKSKESPLSTEEKEKISRLTKSGKKSNEYQSISLFSKPLRNDEEVEELEEVDFVVHIDKPVEREKPEMHELSEEEEPENI